MKPSTKPLKIGLVIDDSLDRNDGVQQYVRTLGGWLSANGHDVHYLTGGSTKASSTTHSLSRNLAVRFNGNRLTIPLPANKAAIRKLLEREQYDVLHIQMPYSPLLAGRIINLAGARTAVVGTFHILPLGQMQTMGSRLLASIQRGSLNRFDAICSVSVPAQAFAKKSFGIKTSVIPNMIDAKLWQSSIPLHPGRVVFLGRLVPRKGCLELLKAVQLLSERTDLSRTEVLIGGNGPELKKLKAYCERTDLSQVKFLGYVEEKSKASLLASAEIAAFPSLGGESFGIVLIEAMAAGAGVVLGGDNPGYRSVLAAAPEALIDARNTKQFSDVLEMFLTNKKLRGRIRAEQNQTLKNYDTAVVGKEILGLYKTAQLHRAREMR